MVGLEYCSWSKGEPEEDQSQADYGRAGVLDAVAPVTAIFMKA